MLQTDALVAGSRPVDPLSWHLQGAPTNDRGQQPFFDTVPNPSQQARLLLTPMFHHGCIGFQAVRRPSADDCFSLFNTSRPRTAV